MQVLGSVHYIAAAWAHWAHWSHGHIKSLFSIILNVPLELVSFLVISECPIGVS